MASTVGIRFRQAGKIFYYDSDDFEMQISNYVVVDTSHGLSVGRVVITPDQVIANEATKGDDLKPVLRLATPEDVEAFDAAQEKAKESVRKAKEMASDQGLDIVISSGEYDLEVSQFTGYFTATERVDFRGLVRDLSRELDARVQLLQVGDRDRAKLADGFDVCGERLCCSSWMTNFPAVSIRMAKEQDLPLNPQKISGVCGRLYCCLTFEYDEYKALRGTLPKVGSTLSTPSGEAKVTGIDFNREVVKLFLLESRTPVEVAAVDFQLQHGVTIRPMELVQTIEGPLRTGQRDSDVGTSPQPQSPLRPPTNEPRQQRQRRGKPASESSLSPAPPPSGAAASASQPAAEGEAGAPKRKRRRRRRGRGGGGDAPASE